MASPLPLLSFRPSSSKRWLTCKASPGFIAQNAHRLDDDSSRYADEGVEAHELAKQALKSGMGSVVTLDEEMRDHVQGYHNFIFAHAAQVPGALHLIEDKVKLFYNPPDGHEGTVDSGLFHPRQIFIDDLKYGAGVNVEAEDNSQLAIYARSGVETYRPLFDWTPKTPITLSIYQPRLRDREPFKEWRTTLGELVDMTEEYDRVCKEIQADPFNQPFVTGPHCQFCKAQAFCRAYASETLGELTIHESIPDFAPVVHRGPGLPAPEALDDDTISRILNHRDAVVQWLNKVENYAIGRLRDAQGKPIPGWKIVRGRANRRWKDDREALAVLSMFVDGSKLRPPSKLISPAQVEKLLKNSGFDISELVIRPEGALTLAKEGDPRPAESDPNPLDLFTDETTEDMPF